MALEKGYALTPQAIEKLRAMRKRLEEIPAQTGKNTAALKAPDRAPARWHAWVRITSTTPDSGRYPGVVCDYDAPAKSFTDVDGTSVWVRAADGGALTSTTAHKWGRLEADAEGGTEGDVRAVYVVDEPPSSIPAFSGAFVYRTSSQTISNATLTSVQWQSENYDVGSYFDSGVDNTKFIIPTTGYYQVACHGVWLGGTDTGLRSMTIKRNTQAVTAETIAENTQKSTGDTSFSIFHRLVVDF